MSDESKTRHTWEQLRDVLSGRYEYLEWLGAGAFGDVIRARQLSTGQTVAIKVLRTRGQASEMRRFVREARACAALRHPAIVRVLDAGGRLDLAEDFIPRSEPLYIVFEYVPGETLQELLAREGVLKAHDALHLMLAVLDALRCAHELGIVHRDLKPANIMIENTPLGLRPKILDFGIAALLNPTSDGLDARLTKTGERVGTPAYCAPEQLRSEQITAAADHYAWALVLLECLTGTLVYADMSMAEVLQAQLSRDPVAMPGILARHRLGELLRWTLEKDVRRRPANAAQLMARFQNIDLTDIVDGAGFLRLEALPRRGGGAQTEIAPAAKARGERRPVAVVCCHFTTSEETAMLDDEAYDEWLVDICQALDDVAKRYGGVAGGRAGRDALYYFGLDYVDGAVGRATRSALEMREVSTRLGNPTRECGRWAGEVRFALDQGLVTVSAEAAKPPVLALVGTAAAALAAACPAWEIAVSERAAQSLGGSVAMNDELRTVASGGRYFLLLNLTRPSVDPPGLSSVIGRETELERLRELWLVARSSPRLVILTGSPGMGKTRLTRAWQSELLAQHATVLEARCLPETQGHALQPILDALRARLGLQDTDPSQVRDRLGNFLREEGIDEAQAMPLLEAWFELPRGDWPELGFSPHKRRQLFLALMTDLVRRLCRGPTVLVLEDIQWADPTTLEWILGFVRAPHEAPFLVLSTVRTGIVSAGGDVFPAENHAPLLEALLHAPETELLPLGPLEPAAAEKLLSSALGEHGDRGAFQSILDRAAGVPLFLLELARFPNAAGGALPLSIAELLRSRIDHLGASKETAQLAALIGPSFSPRLVSRLSLRGPELLGDLNELESAGILALQPDGSYAFTHALLRESAYQSLPRRDRVRLHGAVAQALETSSDEFVAPWLLAWHHHEAGNWEKAISHGEAAASAALQRFDNLEALGYLRRIKGSLHDALPMSNWLAQVPDEKTRAEHELRLMSLETTALSLTRGWTNDELDLLCRRATTLFELVRPEQTVPLRWAIVQFYVNRGLVRDAAGNDRARVYVDELLAVATQSGLTPYARLARMVLGAWLLFHGELQLSLSVLRQIDVAGSPEEPWKYGLDTYAIARSIECLTRWMYGASDVDAFSEETIRLADSLSHPATLALAKLYQGALFHLTRDRERARQVSLELLDYCERYGIQGYPGYAMIILGWATNDPGPASAALQGLAAAGQRLTEAYYGAMVAEAELASGNPGAAWERLVVLEQLAIDTGERFCLPEVLFLRAQCSHMLGRSKHDVDSLVERAIEVAEAQQARGMLHSIARRYSELFGERGPTSSRIVDLLAAGQTGDTEHALGLVS